MAELRAIQTPACVSRSFTEQPEKLLLRATTIFYLIAYKGLFAFWHAYCFI
jgi:hypothetical protein